MTTVLAKLAPGATDMIRADHARVLSTFHRYKTDASVATKRSLIASICLALDVHAQIEEEIFYPAMASVDSALVGRFIPEHDRMRGLIGELRSAEPAEPQYDARVMELMREVMHHVADEETALLPQAARGSTAPKSRPARQALNSPSRERGSPAPFGKLSHGASRAASGARSSL